LDLIYEDFCGVNSVFALGALVNRDAIALANCLTRGDFSWANCLPTALASFLAITLETK
jgi:hypothetical protein